VASITDCDQITIVTVAARSPADGYTLIAGTVAEFTINPALYTKLPYDMERDLTPVAMLSDTPMVLAANSASPYHAVADVILPPAVRIRRR
jgi:tripartite-type tricarboxylate transporter receptor subunit TctC